MLIVGIMMGIAVVRLPSLSSNAELVEESERLLALMNMAADEAVITGTEMGFDVKKNEYKFFVMANDTGKWSTLAYAPFLPRQLAEGVNVSLKAEGRSSKQVKDSTTPTVMFLSSGETTPVEIKLTQSSRTDLEKVISTDGISGFQLEDLDEFLARSSARD
jgi:general secretion pathway protein H